MLLPGSQGTEPCIRDNVKWELEEGTWQIFYWIRHPALPRVSLGSAVLGQVWMAQRDSSEPAQGVWSLSYTALWQAAASPTPHPESPSEQTAQELFPGRVIPPE